MTFSFSEAGEVCPVRRRQSSWSGGSRAALGEEEIYCLRAGDGLSEEFLGTEAKLLESGQAGLGFGFEGSAASVEFAESQMCSTPGWQDTFWIPLERDTIMISCPEATRPVCAFPAELLGKEDRETPWPGRGKSRSAPAIWAMRSGGACPWRSLRIRDGPAVPGD